MSIQLAVIGASCRTVLTVPSAPLSVTASGGDGQATVFWTPPSNNGGLTIIDYTVTASPGGSTLTAAASPGTVTGLTNGTAYTFRVTARNSVGSSAASAPSSVVTPAATAGGFPTHILGGYLEGWASSGGATVYPHNVPSSYNLLFLAFATIGSDGTATFGPGQDFSTLASDCQTMVSAGKEVILSAGGAGGSACNLSTTGQQTAFLSSIKTIINQYHCTGLDWDIENEVAGGISSFGMAACSRDLVATYGSGFAITCAPYGQTEVAYQDFTRRVLDILTFVGFQFYNDNYVPTTAFVTDKMNAWISATGITPAQFTMGFMYEDDWLHNITPYATMASIYSSIQASHPTIRGAWTWGINEDQPTYPFASAMAAIIGGGGGATVPGAPTSVTATAGNASASVSWTAPSSNGGATIIDYTVTSSPGGFATTGVSSPRTVSGLTNGTAYTFRVTARNSVGSSANSAASNSVTPAGGTGTIVNMFVTGFGATDNDPPGYNIAYPGSAPRHSQCGGVGTYADPVTVAVQNDGAGVGLNPGDRVYIAQFQKYGVFEDWCATCSGQQIDVYDSSLTTDNASQVSNCQSQHTGNFDIELNPPPGRTVNTTPLYANGVCYP